MARQYITIQSCLRGTNSNHGDLTRHQIYWLTRHHGDAGSQHNDLRPLVSHGSSHHWGENHDRAICYRMYIGVDLLRPVSAEQGVVDVMAKERQ